MDIDSDTCPNHEESKKMRLTCVVGLVVDVVLLSPYIRISRPCRRRSECVGERGERGEGGAGRCLKVVAACSVGLVVLRFQHFAHNFQVGQHMLVKEYRSEIRGPAALLKTRYGKSPGLSEM